MSHVRLTYLGFKNLKVIMVELFVGEYMEFTTVIDLHSGILNLKSRESTY